MNDGQGRGSGDSRSDDRFSDALIVATAESKMATSGASLGSAARGALFVLKVMEYG